MKTWISVLLVLVCVFSFTACKHEASEQNNAQPAYFVGKVLEAYEAGCLVEVTDEGNYGALAVGTPVHITTATENCPAFGKGDHLRITFDGTVAESYPPQVHHVSWIDNLDAEEASEVAT